MGVLCALLNFYIICIVLRMILSWIPFDRSRGMMSTVSQFLFTITEPLLGPLRRLMPMMRVGGMGLDLSPTIAIIVLKLVVGRAILHC
jgi:YggT family protein